MNWIDLTQYKDRYEALVSTGMKVRWNYILEYSNGYSTSWGAGHELDWSDSVQGQVWGTCEYGNESSLELYTRIFKWIFNKLRWRAWTGLIWLSTWTGVGHLWVREWKFGFHKMWGISWLADDMSPSQEGLCSMLLASYDSALNFWHPSFTFKF